MEQKSSTMIYAKDLQKVKVFKAKHPELVTNCDALRVIIEYAEAHKGME